MVTKLKEDKKPEKCLYNPSFECPQDLKCPLLSIGFVRQLEKWLYTNRTPRSLPLQYRPWQYIPQVDHDWRQVEKANVAAWFNEPEIVMSYFSHNEFEYKNMSIEVCNELVRGYKKFNSERWRRYNSRRKKAVPDVGK